MRLFTLLLASALCTCSLAARADVTGTSVTGGLFFSTNNGVSYGSVNYFNPTNGFVPSGYGNTAGTTVTIGPGTEFGFFDGANLDTANFTGTTLSISDVDTYGTLPFEMTFTDAGFTTFTQLTNASGFTYTFTGHTLDVFFAGSSTLGATYTTTFSTAAPAVTPEPSSLMLLATGALGAFGVARRRFVRGA